MDLLSDLLCTPLFFAMIDPMKAELFETITDNIRAVGVDGNPSAGVSGTLAIG